MSRAVEQSGIRRSQRSRRVGDYVLGELLADGLGYQDRLAKHASFEDVHCRVRQYTVAQASSEEDRLRLKRAAAREFQIIQSLNHPNILPVLDYKEHELGPALLFSPGQKAKVCEPWIDNLHRGRSPKLATTESSGTSGS